MAGTNPKHLMSVGLDDLQEVKVNRALFWDSCLCTYMNILLYTYLLYFFCIYIDI